jgi:uncharacterized protein YndB with AHSA1/START domain
MAPRAEAALATPERVLVVERTLAAPRALVFKLWTDPAHAARWWGPEGFETIALVMDVRPGGRWQRTIRGQDGAQYVKHGVYREIAPPERLAFTYVTDDADGRPGHETLVTVTFTEVGGRTRLTLHQALFESVEARDSHGWGWTGCLARLAAYVAGPQASSS